MGKNPEISDGTRSFGARGGSALVWAMVLVVVLLILIGVMASVIQVSYHGQENSRAETQAYYTARSLNERIAGWLDGTPNGADGTDQQKFIEKLKKKGVITEAYAAEQLDPDGGKMGRAAVDVSINDEHTVITIRATGHFAGADRTVVSSLTAGADVSYSYQDARFKTFTSGGAFDPAPVYAATAAALNSLRRGGIQLVGDIGSPSTNAADLETVNAAIPTATSSMEVMWRSGAKNSSDSNSTVQGTSREPPQGVANPSNPKTRTDTRRLVAAKNGRFLINPIQIGGHVIEDGYSRSGFSTAGGGTNTRFNPLSIDTSNALNKNIKIRIANDGMNDEVAYNGLIGLDFVDNAGGTKTAAGGFVYHPIRWDGCDIFVPSDAKLDETNLIFGMFGHKYHTYLDYWSWGNYVNSWIGRVPGEYQAIYPQAEGSVNRSGQYGLHNIPVTYDRTRLWCMDAAENRYLRVMQGVSLIGGAIYSDRPTIIGGGLTAVSGSGGNLNLTTDEINSGLDGYLQLGRDSDDYCSLYVNSSVMYDQIFDGADIVFADRQSRIPVRSEIRRPDTWRDRPNQRVVTAEAKTFEPKMIVSGGGVYVGKGHDLVIRGSILDNMLIAPRGVTVAPGGAVTIEMSSYFNVVTDMFVRGRLTIRRGAKARGNIVVMAGGKVVVGDLITSFAHHEGDVFVEAGGHFTAGAGAKITGDIHVSSGGALTIGQGATITGDIRCAGALKVEGNFTLNYKPDPATRGDNPDTADIDEGRLVDGRYVYHGIFVYSGQSFGTGTLNLSPQAVISGNSGKIHAFAGYPGVPSESGKDAFCDDRESNNACRHWKTTMGSWRKQGDSASG
jgi:hypothetical protein